MHLIAETSKITHKMKWFPRKLQALKSRIFMLVFRLLIMYLPISYELRSRQEVVGILVLVSQQILHFYNFIKKTTSRNLWKKLYQANEMSSFL